VKITEVKSHSLYGEMAGNVFKDSV
jgi:hypothetical protein